MGRQDGHSGYLSEATEGTSVALRDIRCYLGPPRVREHDGKPGMRLAEVTRVRGDDEEQTADCERYAGDDRPGLAHSELRDLCGDEPNPGNQHEQKPDLGELHARLMCETNDHVHA